ncbi:Uncharacterised protein [Mycobacterium tuberculosis]|nr:Uncharacterised protein [Mycobacterium tuberculosis]CLO67642.1 Uncharacterised protein [Mycobacterium tuberculosis]CMJ87304.1 Uncharacterised protein [Mycobacterium tuberculosis]CMM96282.1 Uncharacterised protein [Mycobacterium tuberculosis]CMU07698.1 Uncharacterised protein [Mycobacterium tuberculosis]
MNSWAGWVCIFVIWIPEISMLPVMPRPDSRVVAGALKLTLTFPSRPKLMAGRADLEVSRDGQEGI